MSQDEKNHEDSLGFSPIHLTTLASILDSKGLSLLKTMLKDPCVNPCKKNSSNIKPIEEPILYVNLS